MAKYGDTKVGRSLAYDLFDQSSARFLSRQLLLDPATQFEIENALRSRGTDLQTKELSQYEHNVDTQWRNHHSGTR